MKVKVSQSSWKIKVDGSLILPLKTDFYVLYDTRYVIDYLSPGLSEN